MAKMKKSVTGTSPVWQVCTYAVLLLVVLVAVFPAIWMLSTSIKLPTEQYNIPPQIIPDTPTISNYVNVLTNSKMYLAFINSVIITACVVAVTLFISILAGYGLSRARGFEDSSFVWTDDPQRGYHHPAVFPGCKDRAFGYPLFAHHGGFGIDHTHGRDHAQLLF